MKINHTLFTGITCDSRKVQPGFIFAAICGQHQDGHNYIPQAIQNGAALVITEKSFLPISIPFAQVYDTRKALATLSAAFCDHPSRKTRVIGVTGTNGKTTTTHMLHHIFQYAGKKSGVIGTTGIYMNNLYTPSSLTTPDAEQLQFLLKEMVQKNIPYVCMEVSSHGILQERVHGIEFDTGIYTNLTKDHMDIHPSFESYLGVKSRFFSNLGPDKAAIVNADDPFCSHITAQAKAKTWISYGIHTPALCMAYNIQQSDRLRFDCQTFGPIHTVFDRIISPFEVSIELPIYGLHNVYNALAAIAAALYYNIDISHIEGSLRSFEGVKRRFQWLPHPTHSIIDDFCHNPAGYAAVFRTVKTLPYKNLYVVNAIRGNRGLSINQENAEVLGAWASTLPIKRIFLTSSRDVVAPKDQVSVAETQVYIDHLTHVRCSFEHIETLADALTEVLTIADSHDLILLLGAQGMDPAHEVLLHLQEKSAAFSL